MSYVPGKGTELKLDISSVFTAIAQVVNLTPPSMEMGTSETTHLASTWREYISSIPDGGEIELTIEYDSASSTHASLWSKFTGGAVESWQVVFNDVGDTLVAFSGIITGFEFDEVAVDNVVTATVKVKITGAVTITP
jgi:predicted secreted protein